MEVAKKLDPGAHGTKHFSRQFGERLGCVRYRLDRSPQLRLTTVEITAAEKPWLETPRPSANPHPNRLLTVKIGYQETRLRQRVKSSGGQWLPDKKFWRLPMRKIMELGLEKRIVNGN